MRDHHIVIAGLTGVILLGALALGAEEPNARVEEPAQTAVFIASQPQTVPAEALTNDSAAPKSTTAGECVGIAVRATEALFNDSFETGNTIAWGPGAVPQYSAIRILDLDLTVVFVEGFSGDHLVHLKLLTPKGHHYQTLSAQFASNPVSGDSLRRVEGYPRPLAVHPLYEANAASLPHATMSIPVGGSMIVTNSIFGTWTAEAYLDDQSEICASQPFVLTP